MAEGTKAARPSATNSGESGGTGRAADGASVGRSPEAVQHSEDRKQALRMWRELKAQRQAKPPSSGAG